jgi:hypothetical protein
MRFLHTFPVLLQQIYCMGWVCPRDDANDNNRVCLTSFAYYSSLIYLPFSSQVPHGQGLSSVAKHAATTSWSPGLRDRHMLWATSKRTSLRRLARDHIHRQCPNLTSSRSTPVRQWFEKKEVCGCRAASSSSYRSTGVVTVLCWKREGVDFAGSLSTDHPECRSWGAHRSTNLSDDDVRSFFSCEHRNVHPLFSSYSIPQDVPVDNEAPSIPCTSEAPNPQDTSLSTCAKGKRRAAGWIREFTSEKSFSCMKITRPTSRKGPVPAFTVCSTCTIKLGRVERAAREVCSLFFPSFTMYNTPVRNFLSPPQKTVETGRIRRHAWRPSNKYLLSAAETLQHNWGVITDAICHFSQL